MQTTTPPAIDRATVEEIKRQSGEDSPVYQRAKEQLDDWEAYLAANRRENDRLQHARLKKLDDDRAARAAARDERELAALKTEYRGRYLRNPGATEADFERVWPELLAGHRQRQAAADPIAAEVAALRARGGSDL